MSDIVSVTSRRLDRVLQDGLALFDNGEFEKALKVFDEGLTQFGPQPDLSHWKGITLRHLGKLDEAVAAFEAAVNGPGRDGSQYELALLLIEEMVDPDRGCAILVRLSEQGDLPAREYLAHLRYEEGQFDEVLALTRAPRDAAQSERWPESVDALETLEGIALTEMGLRDQARFHLKKATQKNPSCASHQTNLGRIYQLEGRHTRALKYYMQAIELDPDDPVPRINLAYLYEEMGRLDAARDMFRGLAVTFSGEIQIVEDYAAFLARHGELDEAMHIIERSLQDQPDDDLAAFLGWLAYEAGDLPRARAIWENQVNHQSRSFAAHHYLAGLLSQQGEAERALELLEAAQRIDPAAARMWCLKANGEVEECFVPLTDLPRFRAVAGLDKPA